MDAARALPGHPARAPKGAGGQGLAGRRAPIPRTAEKQFQTLKARAAVPFDTKGKSAHRLQYCIQEREAVCQSRAAMPIEPSPRPVSPRPGALAERIPPHAFFLVSALFHYLGPAFAVLLFQYIAPLGVAWLRIAIAAMVFSLWRKPWRCFQALSRTQITIVVSLGVTLAAMNCVFYEAIDRLPLATVGTIEFLGQWHACRVQASP
jgi:uncharacterized membrane protein